TFGYLYACLRVISFTSLWNILCSRTVSLIFHQCSPSHAPPLSPRGSSGTAGETLPHRDWATGSEDQGLSERVLLRKFICSGVPAFNYSHLTTLSPPHPRKRRCCYVTDHEDHDHDVSDLVGELQEMQSATNTSTAADLLKQGAACNVLYLNSVETESLTGPEAVSKATKCTLALSPRPVATVVHFKVSSQGITLTDSKRRLFFRRHYPINSVTFSSLDPQDQRWVTDINQL
uniref:PTB domain-containing protein n=1 Tax=Echeneis naucrates TaxID=173247 RepID=A0A665TDP9_ECHNA